MSSRTDTDLILRLIDEAMSSREAKQNDWPGMPLGHVNPALGVDATLHALIADGTLTLIERPRKVNPAMTAKFVKRA